MRNVSPSLSVALSLPCPRIPAAGTPGWPVLLVGRSCRHTRLLLPGEGGRSRLAAVRSSGRKWGESGVGALELAAL